MRSLLDHQADGIEYTLHSHGIEASVVGGNVSPRLIQFHIKLGSGVKFNRVSALSDEMALALGITHCRITRDGYYVKVEVPRPDPQAVRLFPLMQNLPGTIPPASPILGLDETGVPLLLRINSPDVAHILISGTTGSGKTILARSMIASLALQNPPDQLRLLLIDPKGRGYRDFNGLPHLICPVVTDVLDGLHRLKWAVRHMEKRDEKGISSPWLVIFIDELADLIMVGGKEMEVQVARLTQRGREAGIHIVACIQKPSAQVIGGVAKSNFPTRLVGRVVSPEDARVASGVAGSGAERLMGRGDFLLFAQGESIRVQGAHISQDEMYQTVEHLNQQYPMEVRQAAGQTTAYHRTASPGVQPTISRSGSQSKRQFSRAQEVYSAGIAGSDATDEIGPIPPRSHSQQTIPAPRSRKGTAAQRYRDALKESQGVSERLEAYHQTIRQRRQQPAGQAEAAPSKTAYSPPKPKTYDQDIWSSATDDEFLDELLAQGAVDRDYEDFEEYEEPSRPTSPRPAKRDQPAFDDSQDFVKNMQTRRSHSFKIGS
jgi:S-DNA-T family DNA segregation ATPase FtsK/SpoIIIE